MYRFIFVSYSVGWTFLKNDMGWFLFVSLLFALIAFALPSLYGWFMWRDHGKYFLNVFGKSFFHIFWSFVFYTLSFLVEWVDQHFFKAVSVLCSLQFWYQNLQKKTTNFFNAIKEPNFVGSFGSDLPLNDFALIIGRLVDAYFSATVIELATALSKSCLNWLTNHETCAFEECITFILQLICSSFGNAYHCATWKFFKKFVLLYLK